MCAGSWAGVKYLHHTVLMSSKNDETAVRCYDPALLVLVMLGSRNIFHIVSALHSVQLFVSMPIFLADQISCTVDSTLMAFILSNTVLCGFWFLIYISKPKIYKKQVRIKINLIRYRCLIVSLFGVRFSRLIHGNLGPINLI